MGVNPVQIASQAGQSGVGLAKTIESLVNIKKTKKIAKELEKTRPKLGRDALLDENLAFAKSELANGMSAGAEKAYNDISDRQFSSSLNSILKGGGNLNSIGDVYGAGEEGRQRLALMKDQLRLNQINNKVAASKAVADRNDQMFLYNIDAPWKDKAQANAAQRQAAQQGFWNGLQSFVGGGMNQGQNATEKDEFGLDNKYNKILGTGTRQSSGGGGNSDGGSFIDPSEIVW